MQSLHNILRIFIKDYGLEGGVILNAVRSQWESIVGQTVAAHTLPDTIRDKVLTIIIDTPQWLHHLSFYKEDIAVKLKHYNVTDIRFKLGRILEKAKEEKAADPVELTEEDMGYIKNTLKNITDEDLKEKFRTLIIHGLTKGKGNNKS